METPTKVNELAEAKEMIDIFIEMIREPLHDIIKNAILDATNEQRGRDNW